MGGGQGAIRQESWSTLITQSGLPTSIWQDLGLAHSAAPTSQLGPGTGRKDDPGLPKGHAARLRQAGGPVA